MTIVNKPNWKLALGIPLCIIFTCFMITLTVKFKANPELFSNAILIDLLIIAPLAYFLILRKSTVPKLSVSRVFIAGLLAAGWLLKDHSNTFLQIIKTWAYPLIEGMIIFFIGKKFYVANRKAKEYGINNIDFLTYCRKIFLEVIGNEKASNIISSEIAVLYYAFISRKDKNIDYQTKFTSYKENGIVLILGIFLSLFLIETTGVHLLLSLWNTTVAWTLTALSFYTCVQLYAHMKAIKARPLTLGVDGLEIHNGLAGDAIIQYNNIEKIELSNRKPVGRETIKIALIKGFENHNFIIYLKQPIIVTKILGIKKKADTILFYVDRSKDFTTALNLKLANNIT